MSGNGDVAVLNRGCGSGIRDLAQPRGRGPGPLGGRGPSVGSVLQVLARGGHVLAAVGEVARPPVFGSPPASGGASSGPGLAGRLAGSRRAPGAPARSQDDDSKFGFQEESLPSDAVRAKGSSRRRVSRQPLRRGRAFPRRPPQGRAHAGPRPLLSARGTGRTGWKGTILRVGSSRRRD